MEPNAPENQTPPTNPEPATNPMPPQPEAPVTPTAPEATTPATPSPAEPASQAAPGPKGDSNKLPSAFSLFKPSWEALKFNLSTFVLIGLIGVVFYGLVALLFGAAGLTSKSTTGGFASSLLPVIAVTGVIGLLLAGVFGPAMVYLQLKSVGKTKVAVGEALKVGLRLFLRFLGLSIVMGLVIGIGFLLLIVPGLFMLRRYILAPYFLVDKNLGIMEAMKQSAETSKKYSSALWGLIGVTILISLPGIVPVIGGIISAILGIAYYCAPAVRYHEVTTGEPSVAVK